MLSSLSRRLVPFHILILALCAISPVSAQDRLLPVIHFNRLTTADGLPTYHIRSNVVRDRAGFIWVGTVNGLARYDGYICKVYREFTLPNNAIELFIDSKGRFWVGKYANGLSLYDPVKDRFVNFLGRRDDSSSLHASYIQTIYEDQSGILWLGTEDDIVSIDLGTASNETNADSVARHVRFRIFPFSGFKDGTAKVERWDDSSLIVASFGGLFVVDRRTGRISRAGLPRVDGLRLDTLPVNTLFREDPKKLWIGTVSHGLFLLDQGSGSLTGYHKRPEEGKKPAVDQVQELQQDNRGRMWIATGDGVDLFDPLSGSYQDYLSSGGAPGKSMWTRMSVDSTGTLWISTADDGLYYLPSASFRFPHYAARGVSGSPMEMETIDRWSDGSYWITTEGKVAQIRLDDLRVLRIVDLLNGEKSGFGQAVYASHDDGKGTLWFGTWGLGLYSFEPQTGRVKNFRYSRQLTKLAFKGDVCRGLVKTTGDTLWIAGYNDKLLSFDMRRHSCSSIPHDVRGQVMHLMKDRSGKIWISDEMLGLFVVDPSTHRSEFLGSDSTDPGSMSDIHPCVTYQDPRGRVWIGGKNLLLWEPESRSLKPVVNKNIADALLVLPLGSDSRGRLWVHYVRKGLGILDPNTNTFTNFDYSDGFLYPYSMTSLQDGRVMLVGSGGMVLVHPDSLSAPGRAPPLVISRVSINDSLDISREVSTAAFLRLPYDQNVLEFEFAAIDPGQGHLIEYNYRLEGLEDTWIHPAGRRFVRYPGLAPGNYMFRVRAVSAFGRWPDQETTLAISITPPWWLTWWSRTLSVVVFLSLLAFIYKRKVTRLRKEKLIRQEFSRQQIESQEAERKRLAAELHDGLGQDLLVMNNELQQFMQENTGSREELKQVASLVQESIQSVREISSNLHPHHLDRLGFCAALEAMTENLSRSAGLTIQQSCDDINRLLPKETQMHLYRIIQEALSNVVRHASARNVHVQVKKNSESVEITVNDDGKGFNVKSALERRPSRTSGEELHGFGLSSMTERVRIVGGTMKIESAPASGTTVRVSLPFS
jgi:signal transduction histidine kinase/ligand-binding sensor domain-containing protein